MSAGAQEAAPARKRPEELISKLSSTNEVDRLSGLESSPEFGATSVRPLGFTMDNKDFETARRAKRALLRLVRHAGRPGAREDTAAVETKLMPLIGKNLLSVQTRRDLVWILSEIATARSVEPISALLTDKELKEDARGALMRLPYPEALAALKTAFASADDAFKYALADSLRARGEKVEGYASKKLVPQAQTTVAPVTAKLKH